MQLLTLKIMNFFTANTPVDCYSPVNDKIQLSLLNEAKSLSFDKCRVNCLF